MGEVAFDEIYDAGDWFYAAVGDGFGRGGVYKYDGGWSNETQGDTGCRNRDFSSLFVSGNGSSADLVAAANEDDDNRICTSTNATDTWSDRDADGGDDQIDSNRILAGPTRLGGHIDDPQTVFWTSGGGRGGVAISNSGGSGWHDSGLPNEIGDVSGSLDWATDQRVFVPAGESIFYTSNMGEGSSYRRVFRGGNEEGHEARLSLASGFTTHGVAYILRSGKDEAQLLKSTDGAMTFFEIGDDTALDEEKLSVISIRSATTLYVGGDEGSVAFTDDGGASWTLLSTNFGDGKIDEFDFVTATHFYVTAERNNTMEVNETTDGGGSFTQIGETPWGSGTGGFGVDRDFIDKATGEGILIVVAENQSVRGFYKYDNRDPDAKWDKSGIDDVNWTSKGDTGASGIGDGRLWWFWNKGASELWRTYFPISIDSEADWEDLKLATDIGPAGEEISGSISVGRGPSGSYVMYSYRGDDNRLRVYTLTAAFQSRPVITSPLDLSNVPTNVGDEGIPTVFRWTSVPSAACYELQISLEEDFDAPALDPTGGAACPLIDGVSNGSTLQMDKDIFSLVIGQTYFWRARVRSTDASEKNGMRNEGPWSAVQHFTVSTTSPTVIAPEPSLPLNGSQLPGLSTQLSWNNPPGVTQVHIQVSPLNDDGPGINLIMNATSVYSVPAPIFGEGPYVMLPGATYTWRVQITNAVTAIGENDPSWGPWSEPRTFTTAPPISGTIGLLSPIGGAASSDTTPTLEWKDSNPNDFYFEVQLSHDKNFGEAGAVAPVFHNLIHGGQSDPPNSYTVPDAFALSSGTYFWRVRQRVQATPSGASETGIAWTPAQTFVVQ